MVALLSATRTCFALCCSDSKLKACHEALYIQRPAIPMSVFFLPYDVTDNRFFAQGLFPAILNLASNAHISTNATCGEKGPEMFCKLVEHVPGRPLRNAQCRVCDHHSANPKGKFQWGFLLASWVCHSFWPFLMNTACSGVKYFLLSVSLLKEWNYFWAKGWRSVSILNHC